MPRRARSTYYSSYNRQEKQRKIPSPLPYLLIALLAGAGLAYFHFFAYQSISGKITNAYTGAPMPGVRVVVQAAPPAEGTPAPQATTTLTATTGPDGSFVVDKVPENPIVLVEADGFAPQRMEAAGRRQVDVKLVPNVLRGTIMGADGKPLVATITAGGTRTVSGADGNYLLKSVPEDRKLVVKAPGYLAATVQFGQVVTQNVTLEPFVAKAIYINGDSIATPGKLQALLSLVDRTELNAVVIDVKADNSGLVLYDSKLPLVQELGTSQQLISNLDGLLADLKGRKIYTIARLSVFWDQAATNAKPEWALKSKKASGQVWVDGYGKRWANPYNPQVWDYNIAIAKEVASRGFNEVQFDNTQFPSEGELEDIDFGPEGAGKKRVDAIAGFLDRAYGELSPLGVYVASNVFGLTPFVQDDMGVGQRFEDVAAKIDYICPAIYPSLFGDGFMDFPIPAERPFEVVAETMQAAVARSGSSPAKVRPWLQDFSGKVQYDAAKVRAEIDAAEQSGAVGWMLWNFGNVYTEGALKAP
ncbi:MAG TPA: putative glycoside hydrolase [Chloroflexia bacterium]|jgi:hypothetical protein